MINHSKIIFSDISIHEDLSDEQSEIAGVTAREVGGVGGTTFDRASSIILRL